MFNRNKSHRVGYERLLGIERLERRDLLAIDWINRGALGSDTDGFEDFLGPDVAPLARVIAQRAVDDWNAVINSFNYAEDLDGPSGNDLFDTFELTIEAFDLNNNNRGQVPHVSFAYNSEAKPIAATVQLDDDAVGTGWFFDTTPFDDAEFTAIADTFSTSFDDAYAVANSARNDFYRTVVHEIGHALGITSDSNAAIASMLHDLVDDTGTAIRYLGLFNQNQLTQFLSTNSTPQFTATFIGGHLYEGSEQYLHEWDTLGNPLGYPYEFIKPDPAVVYHDGDLFNPIPFEVHPNELLNPGDTVPAGFGDPGEETVRQFISDLTVKILADAYGYTVTLPSTLNTAHATLDSLSGVLLVQDIPGGDNDITLDIVGSNIQVDVDDAITTKTELVPLDQVRRIVIAQNGSSGSINVLDPILQAMRHDVDYVVSSNEDAVDNDGDLTNGLVDLDSVVPGNQVTLRAAIQNANNDAAAIYVPRIPNGYTLTRKGTEAGNATYNDLDITGDVTIIGAGAGLTVIDASGLAGDGVTAHDRIFHVRTSGAELNLSHVTLTGGNVAASSGDNSNDGGAILADADTTLNVSEVAFVDNSASIGFSGTATGGAIRVDGVAAISRSVFVGYSATTSGGAIYTQTAGTGVTIYASVFAQNSATNYQNVRDTSTLVSLGHNLVEPNQSKESDDTNVFTEDTDKVATDTADVPDYVVTTAVDELDSNDHLSLREAIDAANTGGGLIWVPAWLFRLTRTGTESDETNDLDILDDMKIRGLGPGMTVLDASLLGLDENAASGMALDDRIFEVAAGNEFELYGATLTGGHVTATEHTPAGGGAIHARLNSTLTLEYVAVVDNHADRVGGSSEYAMGGGVRVDGAATITRSVFTNNSAITSGGAMYSHSTTAPVNIGTSVFAHNTAGSYQNVRDETTANSTGGNIVDADGDEYGNNKVFVAAPPPSEVVPDRIDMELPNPIVVTTVEDTFDQDDGPHLVSLRDAVFAANAASGDDEVWIPGWHLRLTRVGAAGNVNEGDVTGLSTQERLSTGDIDIRESLTLRGVVDKTTVDWAEHASNLLTAMTNGVDRVFELEGDYNGNRISNTADYLVWANSSPPVSGDDLPADGDDDGDVDADDHAIWSASFLWELEFAGVADPD